MSIRYRLRSVLWRLPVDATGRFLQGQLFEVSARDPIALGSVVTLMLAVAMLAGMIPAARAARIDPSKALHEG